MDALINGDLQPYPSYFQNVTGSANYESALTFEVYTLKITAYCARVQTKIKLRNAIILDMTQQYSWAHYSPVILWFDMGLIAREGFSNVSYSKKCALQHTESLQKSSEGKA